jgi:hypothetical protein
VPVETALLLPKGDGEVQVKVFMVVGESDSQLNTNIYSLADEIIATHLKGLCELMVSVHSRVVRLLEYRDHQEAACATA